MIPFIGIALARLTTAIIHDIPGVYGPIAPVLHHGSVDVSCYLKTRPSDFVHPGIWHTHEDLERIRTNVLGGVQPWASAYANFSTDDYSLSNYTQQGPYPVIERGIVRNYTAFTNDVRAAWQNAIMWYITKDAGHWNRSTSLLESWGSTLTDVIGQDRSLLIGLEGDLLVNAAEIMRWEGNWTATAQAKFNDQLYWLFLQQSAVVGQGNYGMISAKALLSFAVYLDDVTFYNYAISQFINNPCCSVQALYEPTTGQSSEAGRGQGE